MLFEMSSETLELMLRAEHALSQSTGESLDFASDNMVADFFALVGRSADRRIALQADQVWARMIKENGDYSKRKQLNIYRANMQDAMLNRADEAA